MTELLDVVVIGAGYAGVAVARDLKDRGRTITILEASDHLGGRTFGKPFPGISGLHADLGGAWINRDIQPLMRGEVARYGIAVKEDLPTQSAVFRIGGVLRDLPVPAGQLGDLERAMSHLANASRRISPSRPLTAQHLQDLDISADDFFAPLSLPPETTEFVYSMLAMYTGAHLSRCSMLNLVAQTAAFGHSAFGFYSALTERFVGGPESLLHAMVDEGRLDVRLSHRVVRVEQSAHAVSVWTDGGVRLDARTCVLAIPTNVVRHVEFSPPLSPGKARVLTANHLSRSYKSVILARNLPPHPFAVGPGALQTLCVGAEVDEGTYVLIGFGAEDIVRIDPGDRVQIQNAVREYYPDAEVIAVEAHDWNADPLFDGTYRWDAAGQAYEVLKVMNEPEGRVYFAGTDIDDSVWRTWMEGALNSAKRVLDRVSDSLAYDAAGVH
jgi:monoamine oxidase